LFSDVRRDSGGDIRPDEGCVGGPDQPEYGGGGPFGNMDIEVGLTREVAAIVEVYGRLVTMRSTSSRLIIDKSPLRHMVSF
jgi:hypothetical protein